MRDATRRRSRASVPMMLFCWLAAATSSVAVADLEANRVAVAAPPPARTPAVTGTAADYVLRLRSGAYLLREKHAPAARPESSEDTEQVYVQFYNAPSPADREALAHAGVVLRGSVNAHAFHALIPPQALRSVLARENVRAIGGVLLEDKLDSTLLTAAPAASDRDVTLRVTFHEDVDIVRQAPAVIQSHAGDVQRAMPRIQTLLATVSGREVPTLARRAEIEWIEPAGRSTDARREFRR